MEMHCYKTASKNCAEECAERQTGYFCVWGVLCWSQVRRQAESALLTREGNGQSLDRQTALLAAWECGWNISDSLAEKMWTSLWACTGYGSSSGFPMSYSFSLQRIYPPC